MPDEIDLCERCHQVVGRWKARGKAFDWAAVRVVHVLYHRDNQVAATP